MKLKTVLLSVLAAALLSFAALSYAQTPSEKGPAQSTGAMSVTDLPELSETELSDNLFPQGSRINGTDVSGMTVTEAQTILDTVSPRITYTFSINGSNAECSPTDLGVTFETPDAKALLARFRAGTEREYTSQVVSCDAGLVTAFIDNYPGALIPAVNASLSYSEGKGAFVLLSEKNGSKMDLTGVSEETSKALLQGKTTFEKKVPTLPVYPTLSVKDSAAQTALTRANSLLSVRLTYTYSPKGVLTASESIGKKQIAEWLVVGSDGLSLSVSDSKLTSYCASMEKAHGVQGVYTGFQATGGYRVDLTVPAGGQHVNTGALYRDIETCILSGVSGTRSAPYLAESDPSLYFGGTYVEINLNAQHMWLYKSGVCIVSTDIVSGCVNTGCATPPGVYSIYQMKKGTYLVGPGYYTYVNYWMAFNGGIGIHDSTWRSGYGGSIYKYDGSHGCINTPFNAVSQIFEHVTVGTPVVVYGGSTEVKPVTQTITGTSSYTVAVGSAPFKLDASPKYSLTLSYSSSNSSVATVHADGTVTPVGKGTAEITVSTPARQGYSAASMKITVTVKYACEISGEHHWDSGTETLPAGCETEGKMTLTCTVCGKTKEKILPAIGHSYVGGSCVHCGAPEPQT